MATTTAATIQDESGTTWSESLAVYTDALKDTAAQLPTIGAGIGTGVLLLLGAYLLLPVLMSRR